MQTTDTFTDAQGRHYIASHEVPEAVWERYQEAMSHAVWTEDDLPEPDRTLAKQASAGEDAISTGFSSVPGVTISVEPQTIVRPVGGIQGEVTEPMLVVEGAYVYTEDWVEEASHHRIILARDSS